MLIQSMLTQSILIVSFPLQLIDEATGEVELKFLPDESYGKQINEEKTLNEYLAKSLTPMWKKHLRGTSLVFDGRLCVVRCTVANLEHHLGEST